MLWVFHNESKKSPLRIICFILTKMKNEQYTCKNVRVDEDGALKNSTDVTNLLVDYFNISI